MSITLQQVEQLAAEIVAAEDQKREKLQRLIGAYARIISVREPERFRRRCTIFADEDGHWDNSYPPDQEYKVRTGPATIMIRETEHSTRATSGGFYHDTEYFTVEHGLSVDREGRWWKSTLSGTGRYGQFAAHPGACNVDCVIDHDYADDDDVPTEVLESAEEKLREIAFPLAAAVTT
jgi:hypothetical protein